MKNNKIILILFVTFMTSITYNGYCQFDQYDISGSWIAKRGKFITNIFNGQTEVKEIEVNELRFIFDKKKVKINRAFNLYSADSLYNYAFMDTIPSNRRYWNKIKIKFFDRDVLVLEMNFLGRHRMDRGLTYEIYLKKE